MGGPRRSSLLSSSVCLSPLVSSCLKWRLLRAVPPCGAACAVPHAMARATRVPRNECVRRARSHTRPAPPPRRRSRSPLCRRGAVAGRPGPSRTSARYGALRRRVVAHVDEVRYRVACALSSSAVIVSSPSRTSTRYGALRRRVVAHVDEVRDRVARALRRHDGDAVKDAAEHAARPGGEIALFIHWLPTTSHRPKYVMPNVHWAGA